jgi:predicted transcriptional regulator
MTTNPEGPIEGGARDPAGPPEGPERGVLRALGDPVSVGILVALSRGDGDVHSLVVETGLPQSSVYRKLRELSSSGLVGLHRFAFTAEGRKVELFRSRLREVRVRFDQGRLRVDVVRTSDSPGNVVAMWAEVRRFGR